MLNVMVENTNFYLIVKIFIVEYLSNLNSSNCKTDWKLAYADQVSFLTLSCCKKKVIYLNKK